MLNLHLPFKRHLHVSWKQSKFLIFLTNFGGKLLKESFKLSECVQHIALMRQAVNELKNDIRKSLYLSLDENK
jgi:hypothetical protein